MILGALGWLLNLGFAGGGIPGIVAVTQAHDPGAVYESDDTGEALVAHDAGATYEAAL